MKSMTVGSDVVVVCGEADIMEAMEQVTAMLLESPEQAVFIASAQRVAQWEADQKTIKQYREHRETVRQLFMAKIIFELADEPQPIEIINKTYCTDFEEGIFRVLDIKLDPNDKSETLFPVVSQMQEAIRPLVEKTFTPWCHDVVIINGFTSVMALLNYDESKEEMILSRLPGLVEHIEGNMGQENPLNMTLCVGRAHRMAHHIVESRNEALAACWSRMMVPTGGKILFWEKDDSWPKNAREKFELLDKRLRRACETLDTEEFQKSMEEFFCLPSSLLSRQEARVFFREIKDYLFEVNSEYIRSFTDLKTLYDETRKRLSMAGTLDEYKNTFVSQCIWIFDKIKKMAEHRKSRPIRLAVEYVENHFHEAIGAEIVADEIGLSPAYFSYLFKKEMEKNFTEYLTEYRIEQARRLLKEGLITVKEVAAKVGFVDQRYFSKTFKKVAGFNPTEYREQRT